MFPFFVNCPEEIVDQPFTISRIDTPSNKKENYILSSSIINEFFWNYSIITQEKSQLDVLKNIIIPKFAQTIYTPKSDINNSKLIFHFYESLSNLFLKRHQIYLSNARFLGKVEIDFSHHLTQDIDIENINQLHHIVQRQTNGGLTLSFQPSQQKSDKIIQLIDSNPENPNLLADSYLWSILNSNIGLLIKCFEKTFLFKNVDPKSFQPIPSFSEGQVSIKQNEFHSPININSNLLQSYFIYNKSKLNLLSPQTCSFAATPNFILLFNSFSEQKNQKLFLKINLCNHNMTENNRFVTTTKKFSNNFLTVSIGNDVLISDMNGNLMMCNHNYKVLDKFVSIRQGLFSRIPLPFTSDGFYIYSIHNSKEIGVYELDKVKNSLSLLRKIQLNDNCNLNNDLIQKAALITNGFVLEFIIFERIEENNFVHSARTISLLTGDIICDFTFELPFQIHSISFDPIQRRIWTLTVNEQEFGLFNQFKYTGPEPIWLSKFDIATFSMHPKNSNFHGFVDVLIDYVHSISCQFFGYEFEKDEKIPDFLTSVSDPEVIDMIFCLLSQPPKNIKYVQFLFIILSFQFKYKKMSKVHIDDLYSTIRKYITISHLFYFLTLFVIFISSNLKSSDISRFFAVIFEHIDKNVHDIDILLNLLLRLEKSKKFPYLLDSQSPSLSYEIINEMKSEQISDIGINFLMTYQSSLFLNYSRIYQNKIQKIDKIEFLVLAHTSLIFTNALFFIQNIQSIKAFDSSSFLLVLKKLLMDLRLTAHLASFILSLLPILLKFLKEIPKLKLFNESVDNSFYLFYMYVFSLYVFCFKRMLSFHDIETIKKHYKFLDVKMENEKTVSEIFDNNLNDTDFDSVINTIYTKVPNPLNKHLTQEDKEIEKIFFLSILFRTNSIEDVKNLNGQIKENKPIQIPQSIRQIAQAIYRIRSNLRSRRQNGNQNDYLKLRSNYIEKAHFLLKFSTDKFQLKEISDFLNNDIQVAQITQEQVKLESVKKNLDLFIPMANSFIIHDLPINLVYFFIMNIADSSDIISANEIVKKYVTINLNSTKELIFNLLENMEIMPPNAILSFIIYLFFVLFSSFEPDDIHQLLYESISNTITKLFEQSKSLEDIVFKSCISVMCHLIRVLNNEKLFVMDQIERERLTKRFDNLNLKYSMSFALSHSLHLALFNSPKSFDYITQLLGFVGQPKFHQVSLLLFDYLQMFSEENQEENFMKIFKHILDIIGTVLSGSSSKHLLQIAVPIQKIEQASKSMFIKTPTSQLSCVLDLIQIIRKFILDKESNASKMILKHFKLISSNFQPDNQQYMKHLYAMLSVMSNFIKIIRPFSLVQTIDNKTYFVTSLNEEKEKLIGLLLPISKQQFYKHELDISSDLKSSEIIQYNLSLLKDFELPYSLFKKALNIDQNHSPFSLFKLYALHCVKENILDSENGKEFSEIFFNKIRNRPFKNFIFSDHLPMITSLLRKSLTLQTDGIFTNSLAKPKFFHASFTNIVFENDYLLTDTIFKSDLSPHVFVSSVMNEANPVYLSIRYEAKTQYFNFGIIAHSIEHDKKISITFSPQDSKFFINGEKASDYYLTVGSTIECLYIPSKNLVCFADSNENTKVIFSCDLGQKLKCSFFVLPFPGTEINYNCDLNPQTGCFIYHQNKKFTKIYQGVNTISLLFQKDYTEELEGIIHFTNDFKKEIYSKTEIAKNNEGINLPISKFFTCTTFKKLPETDLFMALYTNSYYYSLLFFCSSPVQLNKYIQIHDVSGTFNLIDSKLAIIENSNSIPAFNIQKYHNLPSEILNSYIIEACEFYQQEIMTFIAVQVFATSKNIYSSMKHFSMSSSGIVNFITSVLFLLEPIKFSNLNDAKSPIEFSEFNGFESCSKTDLYEYFTALTKIINFINENDKEKFTYKWFKRLQKDFRSKYMHFVSQKNSSIVNVRSSIIDSYQTFDLDDVSGWIVFPYKFGCYKMPPLLINHLIYPKQASDRGNYSYSEGKILKIKANYLSSSNSGGDNLITFGIIPISNKSNESLFFSFYHLAVSFKYFVLFAKNNMPDKMRSQIWKLVIKSIIAGSPFFYSHLFAVLSFLQKEIPIDFTPENITMFNSLIFSRHIINNLSIQYIIQDLVMSMNVEKSKKIEHYIFDLDERPPHLSVSPIIPFKLESSSTSELLVDFISSILLYEENENSRFPYYLIMGDWTDAFSNYPPSKVEVAGPNVAKVTFFDFVPSHFKLISKGLTHSGNVYISKTNNFQNCTKTYPNNCIETGATSIFDRIVKLTDPEVFYVKYKDIPTIPNLDKCIVFSNSFVDRCSDFVYTFKSLFESDIKDFTTKFTQKDDHNIMDSIAHKIRSTSVISHPDQEDMKKIIDVNHPPRLCYLRAIYLFSLNYLLYNAKTISGHLKSLGKFLSDGVFALKFMDLIKTQNSSSSLCLTIDRQKGHDYRNGINNLEQNSMIAQFSNEHIRNPNNFRNPERPFHIRYKNEQGVDAGGLMRDFFTELITDIKTPRVGLFIQTPNGRNHEGNYQDCIVPSPAPEISKSDKYYQSIGALIAIAIRTEMKQPDLIFPPFFWHFIITGKLKIDDIYEIDKSYKDVTSNLLHMASEMTEEEFENSMSSISILNIRGNPIMNSSSIRLSKSNCERFIAICNETRVNELINPLSKIKSGFWQNLNIQPPPFVTPSLIELMACGNRIITAEDLIAAITIRYIPQEQKDYFFEVIRRMTNDERKKLLLFSTGLNSLTSRGLTVDFLGSDDHRNRLPTASTCFFSLHLPSFSSADRMYNAFIIAINETGTFENA